MVTLLRIAGLSGPTRPGSVPGSRRVGLWPRLLRPLGALLWLVAALGGPAVADVPDEARKGAALFAESSYTEAAEAFRQATIASPDDARWRYDLGLSEALDQKYEDALNNLGATSRLATPEVAARALYNAGNVNFATGKFQEAARAYRQALLRNPADVEAKHNLELALRELQKAQEKQSGEGNDSTKSQDKQKQEEKQKQDQKDQGQKGQEPEDQNQQDSTGNQPPDQEKQDGEEPDSTSPPQDQDGKATDSTLSREQAERILRALSDEEARLRNQARKMMTLPAPGGKDW